MELIELSQEQAFRLAATRSELSRLEPTQDNVDQLVEMVVQLMMHGFIKDGVIRSLMREGVI